MLWTLKDPVKNVAPVLLLVKCKYQPIDMSDNIGQNREKENEIVGTTIRTYTSLSVKQIYYYGKHVMASVAQMFNSIHRYKTQ